MSELIDGNEYRKVLGRYPTGVTLVTSSSSEGPQAMVIGSFVSVSMEPPLVGFLPGKDSNTWKKMENENKFCVNVLSDQQESVANAFFRKENDPWEVIPWYESAEGLPAIEGSLASIDCSLFSVVEAGDHWFVTGQVLGAKIMETGSPLLFLGGSYGQYRSN
ncbi:MAG: monooxygenase [Acidimicrobiaceae bacterium]|nr:monooxygenase [Acidimicrobiaceae bacterium]